MQILKRLMKCKQNNQYEKNINSIIIFIHKLRKSKRKELTFATASERGKCEMRCDYQNSGSILLKSNESIIPFIWPEVTKN